MFSGLSNTARESDKIGKKNEELNELHDKIADIKAEYNAHKKLSPESPGLQKDELVSPCHRHVWCSTHSGLRCKEAERARKPPPQSGEPVGGPRAISIHVRHVLGFCC